MPALVQARAMLRVPSTFIFQACSFSVSHLSTFVSEAVWITASGLSLCKRFKEFECSGLVL